MKKETKNKIIEYVKKHNTIIQYIIVFMLVGMLLFFGKKWEKEHPEKVKQENLTSPRGSAGGFFLFLLSIIFAVILSEFHHKTLRDGRNRRIPLYI